MRECIGVSVIALWGGSFSAPSGRISLIRKLKRCEGGIPFKIPVLNEFVPSKLFR